MESGNDQQIIDMSCMKDGINDYLEKCRREALNAENIILFGSAKTAELVWEFLQENKIEHKVRSIIDNDDQKKGKLFHNIPISGVDKITSYWQQGGSRPGQNEFLDSLNAEQILIIIASGAAHIIKRQLVEMGIPEEIITEFTLGNMQTNPTPYKFFSERISDVNTTYNLLCDEKSKKVFIGLLKYRTSKDTTYLLDIADDEKEQYFDNELIQLSDEEYFVDCGAFVGDSMLSYAERTGGKWKIYYCFEADKNVFAKLSTNTEKFDNVELHNIGCWDCRTRVFFDCLGSGSSQIVNTKTENSVEVDKLDHVIGNRKVTFIKMDIEGAERRALMGAENIIKRECPKLAISIYHSLDDFIYLPQMMASFNKNYKIYLRHYRLFSDSETVCYAIPDIK